MICINDCLLLLFCCFMLFAVVFNYVVSFRILCCRLVVLWFAVLYLVLLFGCFSCAFVGLLLFVGCLFVGFLLVRLIWFDCLCCLLLVASGVDSCLVGGWGVVCYVYYLCCVVGLFCLSVICLIGVTFCLLFIYVFVGLCCLVR